MSIIGLIVFILVIVLLLYLVKMIPDATIQKVAMILVIVLAILWLLNVTGLLGAGPVLYFGRTVR